MPPKTLIVARSEGKLVRNSSTCVIWLVALVVLVIVLSVVASLVITKRAAKTRNGEEETVILGVDLANGVERWRSEPFSKDFTNVTLLGSQRFVYVVDQARLSALRRATGELAWQASLANARQTTCDIPCAALFDAHLLTLAGDVYAVELATGTVKHTWP
jgi:hypothetical protein